MERIFNCLIGALLVICAVFLITGEYEDVYKDATAQIIDMEYDESEWDSKNNRYTEAEWDIDIMVQTINGEGFESDLDSEDSEMYDKIIAAGLDVGDTISIELGTTYVTNFGVTIPLFKNYIHRVNL